MGPISRRLVGYACTAVWPTLLCAQQADDCSENVRAQISVGTGHSWRPPFGVDRVGAPPVAQVELVSQGAPRREYYVVAYRNGAESARSSLSLRHNLGSVPEGAALENASTLYGTAALTSIPDEVAVHARCMRDGRVEELTRRLVEWPALEVEVAARPDRQINPIDLGTILVPHDWLLLAKGHTASINAAVLSHTRDIPNARLKAWFEGGKAVEIGLPLATKQRAEKEFEVPLTSSGDRSVLHVALMESGRQLWKKEIRTMIVAAPPRWPAFGAVETKLRYDAPISVKDPVSGAFSSLDYATAWNSALQDVVVFLPNGSRFVFWRGSNYIPFWAGRFNTAVCYQWAENLSQPVQHADGSTDFPEPLYDTELRYGRVQIVESTSTRIHVRWTYQSTDIEYNVWGDHTTEDYYFYPDGFGTRVVTLTSTPGAAYQLSEFIVLTPQSAYPLEVLPSELANVVFLDGKKDRVTLPLEQATHKAIVQSRRLAFSPKLSEPRGTPAVYRIFDHKDDAAAAIYFYPREPKTPFVFQPLYDRGQLVAPVYWGSHWPLGRGKITAWTIDDRIYSNPSHNSLAGWLPEQENAPGTGNPAPLSTERFQMLDTLGRSRDMTVRRWAWLIAKTDAPDDALIKWAQSFSDPPGLEVTGARIDFPSYSPERRAIRLVVESSLIEIKVKPLANTINPVFELDQANKALAGVTLDGVELASSEYAWDGATLWVKAVIGAQGSQIGIRFR